MRLRRILIFATPLLLVSCRDLDAVSSLSTRLVTASSSWDAVGQALSDSCKRTSEFNPQLDCTQDVAASEGIAAADQILRNYFSALGDAANGQNFSIQPGLDDLAGSVGKIPGIDGAKVDAAKGLAGFLTSLITEADRQRAIRDLIAQTPKARMVTSALEGTVSTAAATTLASERIELGRVFKVYILSAGTALPAGQIEDMCKDPGPRSTNFTGPTFLMAVEYCRRLDVIDAQTKALASYDASLKVADQALDELQSSQSELRGKALISHLYGMGKQLDADIAAMQSSTLR